MFNSVATYGRCLVENNNVANFVFEVQYCVVLQTVRNTTEQDNFVQTYVEVFVTKSATFNAKQQLKDMCNKKIIK